MQNERKKLEEPNLLDDFLFNAMMTYPEMGEKFTRKILKLLFNKEFRNLKVIAQKSYGGLNTDLRGARLDVYVESDDSAEIDASEDASIYDLEPDKNDKAKYIAAFPQRIRFYHAIIDSRSLKRMDSFMVASNIKKMSRLELLYTCVANLVKTAQKREMKIPAELSHYLKKEDMNEVIYHSRSEDTLSRIEKVLEEAKAVKDLCNGIFDDVSEYQLLIRVLREQLQPE